MSYIDAFYGDEVQREDDMNEGIRIKDIEITPSLVVPGSSNLHIVDDLGFEYTGNFAHNDLGHFLQACSEAFKYFAVAHGIIKLEDGVAERVKR